MALNPDKSHAILFGTAQRAQSFSGLQSIDVAGSATSLVGHIKLLGVTLDSHLTMTEHTKLVSQSSFYHIRALRHIRGVLDQSTAAAIASALISSRLDYANSVLFGSPAKNITRLQRVQNAAARIVAQKPSYLSSVDILRELHWLPIQWRIKFKLASLTFKATHNEVPPYLSRLLIPYRPSRVLRSSFSSNLLHVPRTNLIFGSRSFRAAAPTIRNSLPDSIRSSITATTDICNLFNFHNSSQH